VNPDRDAYARSSNHTRSSVCVPGGVDVMQQQNVARAQAQRPLRCNVHTRTSLAIISSNALISLRTAVPNEWRATEGFTSHVAAHKGWWWVTMSVPIERGRAVVHSPRRSSQRVVVGPATHVDRPQLSTISLKNPWYTPFTLSYTALPPHDDVCN
jgi:hypothetical protein